VIVPPPAPSYTLAPDLGPLSPGQRLALEACLTALTGRLAGVLVTAAVSTETHHVIELITPAGSLIALERIGAAEGVDPIGSPAR
jgi:hypothetical protein